MAGVPLSQPTRDRLERLFHSADVPAATEMLVNECGSNLPFCEKHGPAECERIRYAALRPSDGRLDRPRGGRAGEGRLA